VSGAVRGNVVARKGALFWEYGRKETSFRFPQRAGDRSPNVAVREGRWKLLVNANGEGVELYDVVSDRGETRNVAAPEEEVATRLKSRAIEWRKSLP
jgi:hypothetical protein